MDLNNLRRMAEKTGQRTGPGSDVGSARAGTEDLDDLTLEDENFTVKTLSQSTARESDLQSGIGLDEILLTRRDRLLGRVFPLELLAKIKEATKPMP